MYISRETRRKVASFLRFLVLCIFSATSLVMGAKKVSAEVVVEEDWETATTKADGGINGWDGPSAPDRMFISTDNPHRGTRSLKAVYPPGSEVEAGSIKKHFNGGYDELYIRWYQYFSPKWVWHNTSTKLSILTPYTPGRSGGPGPNLYVVVLWGSGEPALSMQYMADQNYDTVNLNQNQGSPLSFQAGRWYCIEVQGKLNTPGRNDGLVRLWVDDQIKLEYLNRAMRGSTSTAPSPSYAQWNYLDIATNYAGDRSYEQYRWHDDLVISTQRIGCMPGVSDTTAPIPPSGLRVTNP